MPVLTRVPVASASAGFTPTDIAGCQVWLDAMDETTLNVDGGSVMNWNDKSGNANNCESLVSSGINYPTYTAPYVVFDGSSTGLRIPFNGGNGDIIDTDWSIFVVTRTTQTAGISGQGWYDGAAILGFVYGNGGPTQFGLGTIGGNLFVGMDENDVSLESAQPVNNGNLFIAEFFRTSSTGVITNGVTGGSFLSTTAGTGVQVTNIGISIGVRWGPDTSYFGGDIGEILIYDSVLTNTQRQMVEGYLAKKWNFPASLPNGHPSRYGLNLPIVAPTPIIPITFSPLEIPGCKLWLDGSDSATVIMDGAYVDNWADKSGLGNDYVPSAVQYQAPYLFFNGTTSICTNNDGIIDTDWSIFIVTKFTNTAYMTLMDFGTDGIRRIAVEDGNLSVGAVDQRAYPSGKVNTGAPFIAEYFRTADTGLIIGAITGGSFANIIGPTGTLTTLQNTSIGANQNGEGGFLNGSIGEILIYDTVLSDNHRQIVEGYLAKKWGCIRGLPLGHPSRLLTSIIYMSPKDIVWDSLVFYVDATNPSSIDSGKWIDLTGSGNQINLSGTLNLPEFSSAYGGILQFDPNDQQTGYTVDPIGTLPNWTVEIWHYYNNTNIGDSAQIVTEAYNNSPPTSPGINYAIGNWGASGTIGAFSYGGAPAEDAAIATDDYTLPGVGWYHIVGVFDGRTIKLYVNNVLVRLSISGFNGLSSELPVVIMTSYLGGASSFWGGYLSKIRIYGKALSGQEISNNYTLEQGRYFTGKINNLKLIGYDGIITIPGLANDYPINVQSGDPFYGTYNYYYILKWDIFPGATEYTVTSSFGADVVVQDSPTSLTANIYTNNADNIRTFTVTVTVGGYSISDSKNTQPCFLAGSLVQMGDGTTKVIEDVMVNDQVLGAFGEINTVLFLHRPKLGSAQMCKINNEHSTTNHHPHISADKKFYCGDPARVSGSTYGRFHLVINSVGDSKFMKLHGLKKERIQKLTVGVDLKTVEGSRVVTTLEVYSMPPETQLYNLVVGGSHTYHVEGYAVTGWPREDDFNYDTWSPV